MAQVKHVTAEGLRWVKDELGISLERVRTLVEGYLEAPANPLPLQRSLVELHQVRGTLRMVQCDGAALLAEEMRAAVQDLLADVNNAPEKAYEALLGAILQLSDYLDLLSTGEADNALVFLPLINELRVARGAGVVSESALFSRYAQLEAPQPEVPDLSTRADDGGQKVARRRLSTFQAALLRVLKDQAADSNLGQLAVIAQEMVDSVSQPRGYQLFSVVAAVIEALSDEGLTPELEVKRLLGRVGQQIKVAAESGDAALTEVPDELIYGLVYFAGRSASDGEWVRRIRRDYGLEELLPDGEELERLRGLLRGPNTDLVHKLSEAIREDIEQVKDSIDLVMRAGDKAGVDLGDTVKTTESIADTLAMLGLDMLKRVVINQARAIADLAQSEERDENAWMDVAMALLRVEQGLNNALFQHMHRGAEPTPDEADRPYQDLDAGAAAIYREALINLARVKTLIPDFIDDGEAALLTEAARLLYEVEAGLQVLGHEEAIKLLGQLRAFISSRAMLRARERPQLVLLLADAVASTEYYLEALQAGHSHPQVLFERVAECVNKLELQEGDEAHLIEEPSEAEAAGQAIDATREPAPQDEEVDPEIRDVFLEEAADVLETLQRDVPIWSKNLEATDRLVEIRRAFHTFKGSGRMVGAVNIGEFAWVLENMLNRCLEGAVPVSFEVAETVQQAVELLPSLIDDFEAGRAPAGVAPIMERANRLAGEPVETAQESPGVTSHRDSELFRIFRTDAAGRIEELSAFAAQPAPQKVTDDLVRAAHTLKGSAEAVHAGDIALLAGSLEHYADACRAAQRPLDEEALGVVRDAAVQLDKTLAELDSGDTVDDAAVSALVQRIDRLRQDLPQEAQEASSDHELLIVFTDEACDLVDEIDQGLRDWRKTPDDSHHPRRLKAVCHTLKGSARTAEAATLGEVAQALESYIGGYLTAEDPPDDEAFGNMEEVVDGLYDMLDRFRHGNRSADPRPLLDLIAPQRAGPDTEGRRTPVIEIPPAPDRYADDLWTEDATSEDRLPDEDVTAALEEEEEAPPEYDPELVDIFLSEAVDLMEGVDQQLDRWEAQPQDEQPRVELMRLLHTLKGSARMAHIASIGDVSHEMENLVASARTPEKRRDPALIGALRNAADQVHRMLDEVRAGEVAPDARELLSDLRGEEDKLDDLPQEGESPEALETADETADAGLQGDRPEEVEEAPESPAPTAAEAESESTLPEPDRQAEPGPAMRTPAEFAERLFWQPDSDDAAGREGQQETARVPVSRLDDMLNEAGEISIFRARLEQENAALQMQLREMAQTTGRLREQLRKLDIETETQIMARHDSGADRYQEEFDPLEMDRYSTLNELSRGLAESATDLVSLHTSMSDLAERDETLLMQQARVNTSLQQGLMRTLMVPFSRQVQRLQRILRQLCAEYERKARIEFSGIEAELDRNVLERMVAPLEHLLRNAVVHGIEAPEVRAERGKAESGLVDIRLYREGTQLVIEVADDGGGLNLEAIRAKALELGLISENATLDDQDLAMIIFEPGFSTASQLTQAAGRGVGMDVVNSEIKQLGGNLGVDSKAGQGTRFTIRLPLTLAISQALLVQVGEDHYAVPLGSVEGVARISQEQLEKHLETDSNSFEYGGEHYRVRELGELLGGMTRGAQATDEEAVRNHPVLLVRAGERRTAFVVDRMLGSREVVVKPVGPQVSMVPGISGATIMADGEVVLILDAAALIQMQARYALRDGSAKSGQVVTDDRPVVMVVDDSITIRRVAERFLVRHGFRVVTAKDGMDALGKLQISPPDVVLLDIEMPRIDGFELATYMRNSEQLRETPIVMITSRSGDKHRRRADQIGVDRFLTKPYQEQDLLAQIHAVMRKSGDAVH